MTRIDHRLWLACLLAASLAACDDEGSSPTDTGSGNETSGESDTGTPSDSETATHDATDTGSESPSDTGSDTGSESPSDTGSDTGSDTEWTTCPTESDYVGDEAWTHELVVTAEATYCATFSESRTLEEELALKATLRLAPGSYSLPHADGTFAFALPVCVRLAPGLEAPAMDGAGTLEAGSSSYNEDTYYTRSFSQPLTGPGESWSFDGALSYTAVTGELPAPLVLDGQADGALGDGVYVDLNLCRAPDCYGYDDYQFAPCNPTTYRLQRHTVTFDGGHVALDLRLGWSMASTEPGAFVLAEGEFDGAGFSQDDYFKLVYNPEHHHFSRDFAVLFDAPIQGACGLKIEFLDPWDDEQPTAVHTVDCELSNLEERAVTDDTFEELDPGNGGF